MAIKLTNSGWIDATTGATEGTWTDGSDIVTGTGLVGIEVEGGVTAYTLAGDDSISGRGIYYACPGSHCPSILPVSGVGIFLRSNATLDTGDGNVSITGTCTDPGEDQEGILNVGTINTGDGNDTITGTATVSGEDIGIVNIGTINTGGGDDLIAGNGRDVGISNYLPAVDLPVCTINTGDGNDTITGTCTAGNWYGIVNDGTINTGDGNDIVIANGGFACRGNGSVFLGNGDDTLSGFGSGYFDGGPGMDMLILPELPAGQKYEFATSADGMTVTLGSTVMYTTGFEFLQIGNIWLLTSNSFEQANSNWTPNFTALGI